MILGFLAFSRSPLWDPSMASVSSSRIVPWADSPLVQPDNGSEVEVEPYCLGGHLCRA